MTEKGTKKGRSAQDKPQPVPAPVSEESIMQKLSPDAKNDVKVIRAAAFRKQFGLK